MDDKVTAVLAAYHERMREEEKTRRQGPARGADDWRDRMLLAVGPDTGRLINILARSLDAPNILELGTSYGYSGIWLAEAARATGGRLTTTELQQYKSAYAREMSAKAGLADYVDFKVGHAVKTIAELPFGLDFVLLDLWKDLYVPCLDAFYPQAQPWRDHRRRQHDLPRFRGRPALCQSHPRQTEDDEHIGPCRIGPGDQSLRRGLAVGHRAPCRRE